LAQYKNRKFLTCIALISTLSVPSTRVDASNNGQVNFCHGTLLLMIPTRTGIVLAADRKVATTVKQNSPQDRSKLCKIDDTTVFGASGNVGLDGPGAFNSISYTQKHLPMVSSELGLTDSIIPALAPLAKQFSDAYLSAMPRGYGWNDVVAEQQHFHSPLIELLIVHWNSHDKHFEVATIKIDEFKNCSVHVFSEQELYPVRPSFTMTGHVAKLKEMLRPWNWKLSREFREAVMSHDKWDALKPEQAASFAADMIYATSNAEPNDVGNVIDAYVVSSAGATELAHQKSAAELRPH